MTEVVRGGKIVAINIIDNKTGRGLHRSFLGKSDHLTHKKGKHSKVRSSLFCALRKNKSIVYSILAGAALYTGTSDLFSDNVDDVPESFANSNEVATRKTNRRSTRKNTLLMSIISFLLMKKKHMEKLFYKYT